MKPTKLIILLCLSFIILGPFTKRTITETNFLTQEEISEYNFTVEDNKCMFFDERFNKKIENPYFDKDNRPEPKIIGNLCSS